MKTEKLTVFACQLVSLKIEQSERIHKKEFNSPERAVFDVFAIYSTKKASRRLALEKFLSWLNSFFLVILVLILIIHVNFEIQLIPTKASCYIEQYGIKVEGLME